MSNKERVKEVALAMIEKSGLINLSRFELCKKADIPFGSFPHVMGCTFSEFISGLYKEVKETKVHTVNKTRVLPLLRKDQILNASIDVALNNGYDKMTRCEIALYAGVSVGLITNYFGTMRQLKRAVMRAAIQREIPEIIAQGLANNDPNAQKASDELKAKAVASIAI